MRPRVGSLCSGYGGLDLAVEAMFGAETVWHAEIEPAACRILEAHWPDVPNLGDIKTAEWDLDADILTAGYPCQPFSQAGKRKGTDDERHLWPYVAEAVRRVRPRYVVLENVAGHRTLGLDAVLGDLAAMRYVGSWVSLRASDVGATHQRERVFILATDADGGRRGERDAGLRGVPVVDPDGGNTAADTRHGREPVGPRPARWDGIERAPIGAELGRDSRPAANPHDAGRGEPRRTVAARAEHPAAERSSDTDWGAYGTAIRRWGRVMGRPAPNPTEPDERVGVRLAAPFVEWMQGLDEGHVCGVEGLSRNEQLKALGNGVVPQQAAEAVRRLRAHVERLAA